MQVDGYSLDAQTEALRGYAEYRSLRIVGEYCDAGRSGMDTKNRPEFRRMIDDVMSQKDDVAYVLVFKLSRFGRNAADILKYLQILEDFGVDLVSVNESIDSSTQGGRLTLSILAAVAEMEHENITVQFYAAKLESVKNGGWPGGAFPYGYKKSDDGMVQDPYEAEVVKKIYELYGREGSNVSSVASILNESGYKRKERRNGESKPFTYDFVRGVLDNPVYCGKICFNRRTNRKDHDGKIIKYDPDHALTVKGKQEPIVSEEVWNRTQEKRKKIAAAKEKKHFHVYMLSGLLRCPVCGKSLTGAVLKTKNLKTNEYYDRSVSYYKCRYSTKQRGSLCSNNRPLKVEIVDGLVTEILCRLQFSDEFKSTLAKALGTENTIESKEEQIRKLRVESRNAEAQKEKIGVKLDGLDPLKADYDERYDRLAAKLDDIYDRIDELEGKIDKARQELEIMKKRNGSYTDISSFLKNLRSLLDKMTPEEKKELCGRMIERIDLFPEERPDGRIIKSISFRFPLSFDDNALPKLEENGEAVSFTLDCKNIDVALPVDKSLEMVTAGDGSRKVIVRKPTYAAIRQYVKEKYDAHVSSLYIAQTKRKYGVNIGEAYNKPKSPKTKVPHCPPEKEKMILDAFKDFGLLNKDVEYKEGE